MKPDGNLNSYKEMPSARNNKDESKYKNFSPHG